MRGRRAAPPLTGAAGAGVVAGTALDHNSGRVHVDHAPLEVDQLGRNRRLDHLLDDVLADPLGTDVGAVRLRTVAGLRADQFWYGLSNDNPANSGNGSDRIVSPKLSIVMSPADRRRCS